MQLPDLVEMKRRFGAMTPHEFALVKREDLTEAAQAAYDREIERRSGPEWAALQARNEAECAKRAEAEAEAEAQALRGIEGWLTLPALGLIVAPFVRVLELWRLGRIAKSLSPADWGAVASLIRFQESALVALFVVTLFAAVTFFRRRRAAPKLMIALLVLQLGISLAQYIVAASTRRVSPSSIEELGAIAAAAVVNCLIWVPYFIVSRRVRETFVL